MAAIEDLIRQIADVRLRDALAAEVGKLKEVKKFGLVFEEHQPEFLRLPNVAATVGARVVRMDDVRGVTYRVTAEVNGKWVKVQPESGGPEEKVERSSVVVARAFGEPMYPALVPVDAIERAPGKPWHVLISADNYHALQLLLYGYEEKVDVIYIDPPYNTGARDWKYNNDYVDAEDEFRHSKWLSMMKKRLRLAKRLLNPAHSFLVVTIDEKEYMRLGLLLEEIFPGHRIQMVSSQISPSGNARGKEFYRVDEYLFFVYVGDAHVNEIPFIDGVCVTSQEEQANGRLLRDVRWESLLRSGTGAKRAESPLKFYPVFVDPKQQAIVDVGQPLPPDKHPGDIAVPPGHIAVWPMRQDGSEGRWQLSRKTFLNLLTAEHVKIGQINRQTGKATIKYLPTGLRKKIADGEVTITGRDQYGGLELAFAGASAQAGRPKTQWNRSEHSAADYGSSLLRRFIPGHAFTYPKSLYAVADTLRLVAGNNPDAIILDFFAGSGTALHATAYLNAEDGGKRRCFLVTNNEVEDATAKLLAENGTLPGHEDYEKFGIAEAVTWPRTKAVLTGQTPKGTTIPGEYLNGRHIADGFEENAAYFKLDFLDPTEVNRGDKFEAILPILWMLAGCHGEPELSRGSSKWFIPKTSPFAVLLKEEAFASFLDALADRKDLQVMFLVTDSTDHFYRMRRALASRYRCVQLYRSYIDTFRINLSEPGTISAGGVPVQLTTAASTAAKTEGA